MRGPENEDLTTAGGGFNTERLVLRPLDRSDLPVHAHWLNDFGTLRTTGALPAPRTIDDLSDDYTRNLAPRQDAALFSVVERQSGESIGWAFLVDIDRRHRSAKLVLGIGPPSARGKGFGTEATGGLLAYAFKNLGLRSVWLLVYAFNQAGIRAYAKAGFHDIGRRRAAHLLNGRWWDTIYMEVCRESAAHARALATRRMHTRADRTWGVNPVMSSGDTLDTSPILNIVGEKVALGPPNREQLPAYARWFSDLDTMRSQGSPEPGPRTVDELGKWYDTEMSGNPARTWFSVYEQPSLRHIGFVELNHIDHRHRTATMSLMVGEPDARGRGYGTEMARLILDYGFTAVGLHNIMLEVYAFNEAGQRAYRKAGFSDFARRTQAYYADGQWWDIILMEALSTEFESPLLAKVFAPDEVRP